MVRGKDAAGGRVATHSRPYDVFSLFFFFKYQKGIKLRCTEDIKTGNKYQEIKTGTMRPLLTRLTPTRTLLTNA